MLSVSRVVLRYHDEANLEGEAEEAITRLVETGEIIASAERNHVMSPPLTCMGCIYASPTRLNPSSSIQ